MSLSKWSLEGALLTVVKNIVLNEETLTETEKLIFGPTLTPVYVRLKFFIYFIYFEILPVNVSRGDFDAW